MDIEITSEGKTYRFTVRSNAKETTLDLTSYREGDIYWSALSECCKEPEDRKLINIPECVALAAKSKLHELVIVSNKI